RSICLRTLLFFPTRRSSDLRTTRDLVRQYPALSQPMLLRNLEARDSPEVAKLVAAIKGCLIDAGLMSSEADDVFFLYVALVQGRSEEHMSELQSRENLVCRL